MTPETIRQGEQVKTAWYAPSPAQFDSVDSDGQVMVIYVAEAGGPSRPVIVTFGEKQVLTTMEVSVPDCTETRRISIHLLISAERKLRKQLTLALLKEELCSNTRRKTTPRPPPHFTRGDETKLAPVQKVKKLHPSRLLSMLPALI